jgi:hypothetical protein
MAAEAATEVAPATLEAPVAASPEPRAPAKKEGKGKDAKGKDAKKGGKEAKKKKGEEDEDTATGAPSVAAHPRAARNVAFAKGWGGLLGFVLGGYLSLPTNTLAGAGERALVAGVVCYVVAWAGAVFVWRRLVMLELKAREQQLMAPAKAGAAPRALAAPSAERPAARVS